MGIESWGAAQPATKAEKPEAGGDEKFEEYKNNILKDVAEMEKRVYGINEDGALNMQGPEFTPAERVKINSAMDILQGVLRKERNEYNELVRTEGVDSDSVKRSSFNGRYAQLQGYIDNYENLLRPKSKES